MFIYIHKCVCVCDKCNLQSCAKENKNLQVGLTHNVNRCCINPKEAGINWYIRLLQCYPY